MRAITARIQSTITTVLGIVGAGGIGLQLSQEILVNNSDQARFIIILMRLAVAILDVVSRRIRSRRFDDPRLLEPNAATTRWRVAPLPSPPPVPDAPSVPGLARAVWRLDLI